RRRPRRGRTRRGRRRRCACGGWRSGGRGRRGSPGLRRRACDEHRVARREPPARTLRGSWAMNSTVIFDLDGVLVDSRAVFLSCVNYALEKLGLPTPPDAELLPYIGPPFAYGFGELLGVAHDAPIVDACIDGYRERYRTASLTETTVAPGIPGALDALDGRRRAVPPSKPLALTEPLL